MAGLSAQVLQLCDMYVGSVQVRSTVNAKGVRLHDLHLIVYVKASLWFT